MKKRGRDAEVGRGVGGTLWACRSLASRAYARSCKNKCMQIYTMQIMQCDWCFSPSVQDAGWVRRICVRDIPPTPCFNVSRMLGPSPDRQGPNRQAEAKSGSQESSSQAGIRVQVGRLRGTKVQAGKLRPSRQSTCRAGQGKAPW